MPPKEIHEDFMETRGKKSPSNSTVKKRTAGLKMGKESVGDVGRSKDATADVNVQVVHALVMCDRSQDLRITASVVGISFEALQSKIISEYDQKIPQSQTADNPMAPRGRAAQPSRDARKTN